MLCVCVYLGIPDHDGAIPGAGVDELIPAPLDTRHRPGVARQGEEAAPGVGVPHFCSAVLGGCHEAAAGHLHMGWLPGHGHDHLGMSCMTLTKCDLHELDSNIGITSLVSQLVCMCNKW